MTDPWCCYIWCAMDPISKNPSHVSIFCTNTSRIRHGLLNPIIHLLISMVQDIYIYGTRIEESWDNKNIFFFFVGRIRHHRDSMLDVD